MTLRAFVGGRVLVDGEIVDGGVLCDGPRIADVLRAGEAAPHEAEVVDCSSMIVAPGLVDVHVHGGGGHSLMTDDPNEVRAYARWVVRHGVTSFLISTSGRDHAEIIRRLRALAPTVGTQPGGARVLGFHLEGPYINPVRKGAFDPRWLRAPSVREWEEMCEASGGAILQMTVAPELPDADALIEAVVRAGVVASIGHTDATYEQARRAIDLGATHVTHCFNAMRPFGHRDPGVLGAVLESDDVTAELIGDGAHVDYAAARVLLRAKGAAHVVLVTDGMPLAGTDDGEAAWEGERICVEGGKAVRDDGTIVGGVTTLDRMARNAVEHMNADPAQALRMASEQPARAMRADGIGTLAPGAHADLVLLDDALQVQGTWVAGEPVGAR
ncbi:MAG TPA: N-acetylglucosamine-6-phosphate deacetylase [Dehalococcoidia bacterium]|nr:N-acetylglucosamine-6-phosphate deacetylase [Dehalococcoidia bacterium]